MVPAARARTTARPSRQERDIVLGMAYCWSSDLVAGRAAIPAARLDCMFSEGLEKTGRGEKLAYPIVIHAALSTLSTDARSFDEVKIMLVPSPLDRETGRRWLISLSFDPM